MRNRFILAALAACFPLVMVSGPVFADGIDIVDARNTCTVINCNSQVIRGSIQADLSPLARNARWSHTVYCGAGECCRFDITRNDGGETLAMTVVAADVNQVYTETGATPTLEIESFRSGPATVMVTGRLETGDFAKPNQPKRFTLKYGRYDSFNANCANKDLPLVPQELQ